LVGCATAQECEWQGDEEAVAGGFLALTADFD